MNLAFKSVAPFLFVFVLLRALTCPASTTTWNGSADSDWFVAENWSAGVPGDGDDVVINAGADVLLTNETALLRSFTMNGGTLTYSNWTTRLRATNVLIDGGTHTLPGRFTEQEMSNRVWIVCFNDFTLNTNAVIDAYEQGFAAGHGPGRGDNVSPGGGGGLSAGGGYGGGGGRSFRPEQAGGPSYGSLDAPVTPGSGGGYNEKYGGASGSSGGGGAVRIEAAGTVTIHGTINADGGTHPAHGYNGGGSGGAIYITCGTFQGSANGLLSADGGNVHASHESRGGAGGGGRIAVDYTNLGAQHAVRFSTSPGWCWVNSASLANGDMDNNWYVAAQMGTVWLPDLGLLSATLTDHLFTDCGLYIAGKQSWAVESLTIMNCSLTFAEPGFELTVTNDLLIGANGHLGLGADSSASHVTLTCRNLTLADGGGLSIYSGPTNGIAEDYGALVDVAGDVTIGSGSWIIPYSHKSDGGSVLFRMTNVTLAAGGGFNAHARGYAFDQGPGIGDQAGGGAYGGRGGRGSWWDGLGGTPYGSASAPIGPGSGGRKHTQYGECYGGGSVRIEAAGNASIDGTIRVGGGSHTHTYVGVGSGGGIYLTCDTFSGSASGLLSADGGTPLATSIVGGGGGGRIAVHYSQLGNPHAVRFSTSKGSSWADLSENIDNWWWVAAEWGTLYLSDASLVSDGLTDGSFNDVRLVIDGFTSWTVDSLTVSNSTLSFEDPNFELNVSGDLNVVDGSFGIHTLNCAGNVVLTNGGMLSAYNVDCGGNLNVTDRSGLSVFSGMTNGIAENYGALVAVAGDVHVADSSWIYPYSHAVDGGSPLFRMSNLMIAETAGFNAKGRGYAFAQGPGAGSAGWDKGGGGGYGGKGGKGNNGAAIGGIAYGSTIMPLSPGSGSADSQYSDSYGGGLVRIEANGNVTVDGTITADGGQANHFYAGSGAGGAIFICCQKFAGGANGALRADGGNSGASGGGGGGGRIVVWQDILPEIRNSLLNGLPPPSSVAVLPVPFETYLGTVSVMNGTGWSSVSPDAAEPGSIAFLDMLPPRATTILIR